MPLVGNVFGSSKIRSRYIRVAVPNDLSGFEFKDGRKDVFRNLGYENSVRPSERPTSALLPLVARVFPALQFGFAPVEVAGPVGLPEDERPDGECALRHGDDAKNVG
jgi:hypothetical protein